MKKKTRSKTAVVRRRPPAISQPCTEVCGNCGGSIILSEEEKKLAREGQLNLSWCGFCQ